MLYLLLPASITKVNSSRSSHPRKHRRGSSLASGSSLSSYKANSVKSSSSITLNGLSGVVSSSGHRQAHNVSGDVSSTSTGAQSGVQSGIPLQRLPLHRSSSLTSLGSHCSMEQTTSAEKRKTPGSGALGSSFWSWRF